MTITYEFAQTEAPEDVKQRTIVKTEPVPATEKEEKFTLAQKEEELENVKQQVVSAQNKVKELEAEITAIKEALEIK